MTVIQYWMNGRSVEWIARRLNMPLDAVVREINKDWGKL